MQNSMVVFIAPVFRLEIPIENCQFQLKCGTQSNSNMKNSMLMFTVFERKYPFYGKSVSKNQNRLLKLKSGKQTNSNTQNSIVIFILLFFRLKLFELIQSKTSKLSVQVEIWQLDYFECAKFDGHVLSFLFQTFFASFVQKNYLSF